MLRHAIFLILFLVFSVWIGIHLQQDPGFALFAWRNTSVEMPLWFAVLSLLLLLYLCWQLSRLAGVLPHSLYRLRHWRRERQWHRSVDSLCKGLLELTGQRWQKAERLLTRYTPPPELQPLQSLGAAFAAHRQGANERCQHWLTEAPDLPSRRWLRADIALDNHQPAEAIALLQNDRNDPANLLRLQKAYRRLEQWESLLELIPLLRKKGLITSDKAERQERKTARAWLATENGHPEAMDAIWRRLPRRLQQDTRMVRAYLLPMMQHPEKRDSLAPLLTTTLNRQFDATLVRLYGELVMPDPKKQLQQAEKWLKDHPHHPALLLTLGHLAIRCRLWGKARDWLNDCLHYAKNEPRAHAALGWLEEQAGDHEAALAQYREGLREATQ